MQIAVGGCLAQKDRGTIVERAPWVDVVFGTHNIGSLPVLLERARHNQRAEVEIRESLETFPSTLPTRRDSAYAGWVSISVGCNNTCTFCIVPSLRGKETDRRPGDILAEIRALVEQGVDRGDPARPERQHLRRGVRRPAGVRQAATRVRRDRRARAGPVHQPAPGRVHRGRHRRDGRDAQRHAEPAHAAAVGVGQGAQGDAPVLPEREVPRDHRPGPRAHPRRGDHHRHHHRLPGRDRGGLPGHPRRRPGGAVLQRVHLPVLDPRRHARRDMPDQVPKAVVQDRYDRLIAVQEEVSWAGNRTLEGTEVEVLVATGEGRKDAATHRLSGRSRDNRLVHFAVPDGAETPRPGDLVTVGVTYGAPHHLVADSGPAGGAYRVRRTSGGDAWAALQEHGQAKPSVSLGYAGGRAPRPGPGPDRLRDRLTVRAPDRSTGTNPDVGPGTADSRPAARRDVRVTDRSTSRSIPRPGRRRSRPRSRR